MMTYEEALAFLNAPIYSATRPGLEPMKELMQLLGNPQDELKYVHVAGTNGKGSTASFISAILRESGYRTGLYTSPYLIRFTERIRVDGQEISEEDLARLTNTVKTAVDNIRMQDHIVPTIFEMVTAVAFLYFKEKKCDVVVLEVGMGGRLDATNIIGKSELSIITSIDFDHMNFLGTTLEEIAFEKAGIIKPNGRVALYPQKEESKNVIIDTCRMLNADIKLLDIEDVECFQSDINGQMFGFRKEDYRIHLLGKYQIYNASMAILSARILRSAGWHISDENIKEGILNTKWPGRFEVICRAPVIIADGAHNPNGVKALVGGLRLCFPEKKIVFIVGVLADKEYETMICSIAPLAKCFLTVTPDSERALDSGYLAHQLRKKDLCAVSYNSVSEALDDAILKYPDDIICAFGSLYYIGEVCSYCDSMKRGQYKLLEQ